MDNRADLPPPLRPPSRTYPFPPSGKVTTSPASSRAKGIGSHSDAPSRGEPVDRSAGDAPNSTVAVTGPAL
jgi:hypothetical protein